MPIEAIICLVVLLIPVLWLISTSNRFARLDNLIRESWANIDVQLKRRHDLIPNLVETVKAYAAHEQAVFDRVIAARNSAITGGPKEETELAQSVNKLLAISESYPVLRSNTAFLELQHELSETEDRIAAARRFYNANIRDFNVLCQSFPSSLVAGSRQPKDFFEVDSISVREMPKLNL